MFFLVVGACELEVSFDGEGLAAPDAGGAGAAEPDGSGGGSPPDAATPDPTPLLPIVLECESGTLAGQMVIAAYEGASGGLAVRSPAGTPAWVPDGTLPPTRVDLPVELPEPGTYYLWVRSYGPTNEQDALYAGFNADDLRRFYPPVLEAFTWVHGLENDPARLRFDELPAGPLTLSIGPGEEIAACDRILLTDDPSLDPADLGL